MRSEFAYTINQLKQMPSVLFYLTGLCVLMPVLVLIISIRGDSRVPVGLPKLLLITICCGVFVYGFLRATWWSRPLVILYLTGASISAIVQHYATYSFLNYLGLVFGIGIFLWILFFRRDVREYYAKTYDPVA